MIVKLSILTMLFLTKEKHSRRPEVRRREIWGLFPPVVWTMNLCLCGSPWMAPQLCGSPRTPIPPLPTLTPLELDLFMALQLQTNSISDWNKVICLYPYFLEEAKVLVFDVL